MANERLLKMAIIAGASKALKIKRRERMMSDEEVLKEVSNESEDIISKLDSDE